MPLPPRSMTMRVNTRDGVYNLTADVNERKYAEIFDHYYELAAFNLRGYVEKNLDKLSGYSDEQVANILEKVVRTSRQKARAETLRKYRKDIMEYGEK